MSDPSINHVICSYQEGSRNDAHKGAKFAGENSPGRVVGG